MKPLVERRTTRLDVDNIKLEILHPESVILLVEDGGKKRRSLNIGSLCYGGREQLIKGKKRGEVRLVNSSSLLKERSVAIGMAIDHLRNMVGVEGKSHATALVWFSEVSRFLDYCDFELRSKANISYLQSARALFSKYTHWLEHCIQLPPNNPASLNVNTAATKQRVTLEFLSMACGVNAKDFAAGHRKIRKYSAAVNNTKTLCEERYAWAVKVQYLIFTELSQLVLENMPLPHKISFPDQDMWFFHDVKILTASKARREELLLSQFPRLHIDYKSGKVYSLKQLKEMFPDKHISGENSIKTLSLLDIANSDSRHNVRKAYALLATHAFFMHFLTHTGLNVSVAANLPWNKNYTISIPHRSWREVSIKRRGKREVVVEIGTKFKHLFLQYLKLRDWILNGRKCDKLFVVEGNDGSIHSRLATIPKHYNLRVKRFYPECPWVTPKELRKYKGVWVLRSVKGDLKVAADVLQNTPETVVSSYAEGNEVTASIEFGEHWNMVRRNIRTSVRKNGAIPRPMKIVPKGVVTKNTAVGTCDSYNPPKLSPEFNNKALSPDCARPEGCLFCEHFAIHLDDIDIRKLVSCQECLLSLRDVFDNEDHFLVEYGYIIDRIDEVLSFIRTQTSSEVNTRIDAIIEEVKMDGILDPWWSRRMEMLISMGVVNQ